MALADYKPIDATASVYDADQREVNSVTDTVQGQMTGLLDSNSDYMKRAETKGLQTANSRGLLNSSMAAGASQAAAIDAALPIAQQDATTYSTARTTNQAANNTAQQYNAGNLQDVSKTNAAAQNASLLSGQNFEQSGLLSERDYQEQLGLDTNQNQADLALQRLKGDQTLTELEVGFGYETQLTDQKATIETDLTNLQAQIAEAKANGDHVRVQELNVQATELETQLKQVDAQIAETQAQSDFGREKELNVQATELAAQLKELDAQIAEAQANGDLERTKELNIQATELETTLKEVDAQIAEIKAQTDQQRLLETKGVDATIASDLQAQQDLAATARTQIAEDGANYRAELTQQYNLETLDQKDRTVMATAISTAMETYEARRLELATDPDLANDPNLPMLLDFLDKNVQAEVAATASLLGIDDVDFGQLGLPPVVQLTEEQQVIANNITNAISSAIEGGVNGSGNLTASDFGLSATTTDMSLADQVAASLQDEANKASFVSGLTEAAKVALGKNVLDALDEFTTPEEALAEATAAHQARMDLAVEDTYNVDYGTTSTGWGGYSGYGGEGTSGSGSGAGGDGVGGGMGGSSEGSCFVAGTTVICSDGSIKNIEDVVIGEYLLGLNGEFNEVLDFDRPTLGSRSLYAINDDNFFVTSEHPFMTPSGWKSFDPLATASEKGIKVTTELLSVGDEILTTNENVKINTIYEHNSNNDTQLYNFRLNGNNTYYANNYLVHNKI